jgi:thiol-disulfide isomerase/thioredoxin
MGGTHEEQQKLCTLVLVCIACTLLVLAVYVALRYYKEATRVTSADTTVRAVTLTTEAGELVDIAALTNTPLIVTTWATWCGEVCLTTLRTLDEVKKNYGDKVEVLAVNRKEEQSIIDAYRKAVELPSRVRYVVDSSDAFMKQINGTAIPEIMVYSARGDLIKHFISPPTIEELNTLIETTK